jgi:SOS-response transcriptional repressor LexA
MKDSNISTWPFSGIECDAAVWEPSLAKLALTQKQQTVFDFIQRYCEEHGKAPFIREIQLGCQIASYKSVLDRLNALERKQFIKRVPNKHRGIEILPRVGEPHVEAVGAGAPGPSA